MIEEFIENEFGEQIYVVVEGLENKGNKKLAFIMHGLSGNREYPEIPVMTKAFIENGFVVVTFDTRFAFGKSFGSLENATLTHAVEDLETVIDWAANQEFYAEPFALAGHSLGGGAILKYAKDYPENVSMLVPLSTVVCGELMVEAWKKDEARNRILQEIAETGKSFRRGRYDKSQSGSVSKKFIDDIMEYDITKDADKLDMPILLITGDEDPSSTIYNNQLLFEKLKGDVSLEIITGVAHNFDSEQSKSDLHKAIYNWVKDRADGKV